MAHQEQFPRSIVSGAMQSADLDVLHEVISHALNSAVWIMWRLAYLQTQVPWFLASIKCEFT